MELVKPTCEEILEEVGFEEIHSEIVDKWRWGTVMFEVFRRESDETLWGVDYRVSTDGETNELREGIAEIYEVKQVTRTITSYEPKNK